MKGNKAKVISLVNLKGGVGKTTTAQNLGSGLTREGKRVLFIDLDIQMNLSFVLKASGEYLSIYEVLKGNSINKAIQETEQGELIRGDVRLSTLQEIPTDSLKKALEEVLSKYDYIIIDTPPRIDNLIMNALVCSDEVIIPCNTEIFSLQGILTEKELIETVKSKYNQRLKINGILITNYETRGALNKQFRESIEKQAERLGTKVYKTAIRKNIAIKKAQALRTNIFEYDSKSNGAEDYKNFIEEFKENE